MDAPFNEIVNIRDPENVLSTTGKNFLSMELLPGGFSYSVLDTDKFRYTYLESVEFEQPRDHEHYAQLLDLFTRSKKLLTSSYQRISLAFSSPKVTFVPADLFSYMDKNKFVDFNIYPEDDFEIKTDKLNNLSAYALYPFPRVLLQKINYLFPGCRLRHISTSLIENILYMVRYGRLNPDLVIHVQKDHFEVLVFENEELSFYNSFNYHTWDDLFYYLFFVLEQLGLQAEDLNTMVYGEVSIQGDFYKKLRLYVKSLSFGPRSDLYRYSEAFDEVPHHFYFNLLNLNACG